MKIFRNLMEDEEGNAPISTSADVATVPKKLGQEPLKRKKITDETEDEEKISESDLVEMIESILEVLDEEEKFQVLFDLMEEYLGEEMEEELDEAFKIKSAGVRKLNALKMKKFKRINKAKLNKQSRRAKTISSPYKAVGRDGEVHTIDRKKSKMAKRRSTYVNKILGKSAK
mgnify:CR=1 FL=1